MKKNLLLSTLVLIATGSLAPAGNAFAADDTSPCSHLSREAASTATGIAFSKAEPAAHTKEAAAHLNACEYEGPPVGHGFPIMIEVSILKLQNTDLMANIKMQQMLMPSNEKIIPVSGLGDEAYQYMGLHVRKGSVAYYFGFVAGRELVQDQQAVLMKMAKAFKY